MSAAEEFVASLTAEQRRALASMLLDTDAAVEESLALMVRALDRAIDSDETR